MSSTEHKNVEMISKLMERCKFLQEDLDLKNKENLSLQKNLEIMQNNFEDRRMSFEKDLNDFIRTSDLEKEKDRIEKFLLEERAVELQKEIKDMRNKLENM